MSEIMDFAKAILHGDDEQRAWLLEAATNWEQGKPLPPPRSKRALQSTPPVVEQGTRVILAKLIAEVEEHNSEYHHHTPQELIEDAKRLLQLPPQQPQEPANGDTCGYCSGKGYLMHEEAGFTYDPARHGEKIPCKECNGTGKASSASTPTPPASDEMFRALTYIESFMQVGDNVSAGKWINEARIIAKSRRIREQG